jgi:hypothetical protein
LEGLGISLVGAKLFVQSPELKKKEEKENEKRKKCSVIKAVSQLGKD